MSGDTNFKCRGYHFIVGVITSTSGVSIDTVEGRPVSKVTDRYECTQTYSSAAWARSVWVVGFSSWSSVLRSSQCASVAIRPCQTKRVFAGATAVTDKPSLLRSVHHHLTSSPWAPEHTLSDHIAAGHHHHHPLPAVPSPPQTAGPPAGGRAQTSRPARACSVACLRGQEAGGRGTRSREPPR